MKGCAIEVGVDPMHIPNPEIFLKTHASYREGQLAEIFSLLRLDTVRANCRYFQTFLNELVASVGALSS
jgi:hypothetical protein